MPAIIVSISASQMITYAGTPISQAGWTLWHADSEAAPTYAATNAFDGNSNTMWHNEWSPLDPLPHELHINLGASYDIDGIRYLPRQDGGVNGRIGQYEIYVSTDGNTWGAAVHTGTFPNDATEQEVTFTPTPGQYIRLRAISELNGNQFTSVAEINVLASTTAGGECTDCPAAWSKIIRTKRFALVMNGAAVLDRETCLVWASPLNPVYPAYGLPWDRALSQCIEAQYGLRQGWRVPTIGELMTLQTVDSTETPNGTHVNAALPPDLLELLKVPNGNLKYDYWTSTTDAADPEKAWSVKFGPAFPNAGPRTLGKESSHNVMWWCVRGP